MDVYIFPDTEPADNIFYQLIDLDQFETVSFDLDHANEAVAHAAANGGPFKMTVIKP